jgi:hypothetical protein
MLERLIRDDVDCLHAKERLKHLAASDKVEYIKRVHEGKWWCQIKVGEEKTGGEVEGYLRVDVEAEAATRPFVILEGKARERGFEEKVVEADYIGEN